MINSGLLTDPIIIKSESNTKDKHQFIGTSIQSGDVFNLDVDGDRTVRAFSDGFMVLRKMFGDAFAGDALTNKAITDNATRDTDEIHEYIAALTTIDPIS